MSYGLQIAKAIEDEWAKKNMYTPMYYDDAATWWLVYQNGVTEPKDWIEI